MSKSEDGGTFVDQPSSLSDEGSDDLDTLEPLLAEIRHKHGKSLQAVLVYGSWLRGKRDTMLDFYVLVDDYSTLDAAWQGWLCRLLPPNVYHIHHADGDTERRAKYAVLTLKRFRHAIRYDFHSYFWARFAQPCKVLYARDDETGRLLENAFEDATSSFVKRVLPTMKDSFNSRDLWTGGLSQTYRCELRTESNNRPDSIYDFNPEQYDRALQTLAESQECLSETDQQNVYQNHSSVMAQKMAPFCWWVRRVQGKMLSVLRLTKAALTFNEPLQYLLWKIKRHTGIYIAPSQRQLDYPLIFAWPLLWKLYREGAFR